MSAAEGFVASFTLARCTDCIVGNHRYHDHTWLTESEARVLGLPWPLPPEEAASRPCSCICVGADT